LGETGPSRGSKSTQKFLGPGRRVADTDDQRADMVVRPQYVCPSRHSLR
jgi:hypothetical protein